MDVTKAFRETCVCLHLESDTKDGLIAEMIGLLVAEGRLSASQREPALRAVMEREEKMSTGVQHGVAMPHGKTEAVDRLVAAIALKKEGVDFGSIDGLPSQIFVMTVSSPLRTAEYMEYLGAISRVLNSANFRKRLLAARTRSEVLDLLAQGQ